MKPFTPPSQEAEDEALKLVDAPPVVPGCPFVLLEDAFKDMPVMPRPMVDYFEDPYF